MKLIKYMLLFSLLLVGCSGSKQQVDLNNSENISQLMAGEAIDAGFSRALKNRQFSFPADHAAHTNFQTEWWYITGNLQSNKTEESDSGKRHFGFQLTIFRRAISPDISKIKSKWSTNQVYMAHFSVSDIENNQFYGFERFSRDSLSLAGVNEKPFKVWLLDWEIKSQGDAFFPLSLHASDVRDNKSISIELNLNSEKPLVLQGDRGLSRKSDVTDNASYYYSYTHLNSTGKISIGNQSFDVEGAAWLDREWSTSALDITQSGWDWFALQLNNNEEIMFYLLRKKDGSIDQASAGSYVRENGESLPLKLADVKVEVLSHWASPSGIRYPAAWRFIIAKRNIDLQIEPHMSNQEIKFSVQYWEGAVKVEGTIGARKIVGHGYVELAGYSN